MSRVLIVEDEEAIADLEKDYLELSGFTVEIENNGTAGLKRALSEEFDMFILDLMLPGTDGFEICKKIREEKNTPILLPPVIDTMEHTLELLMGEINCAIEPAGDSNKPIPMHIMTNKYQINGASVLLYHGLLDGLAEKLGTDLYVIPSSIHELIIMPAEDGSLSLSKLSDMVKEINENHVKEEEILSDCAYYYDHKEKSFYM